jgi:hypothetical protein
LLITGLQFDGPARSVERFLVPIQVTGAAAAAGVEHGCTREPLDGGGIQCQTVLVLLLPDQEAPRLVDEFSKIGSDVG